MSEIEDDFVYVYVIGTSDGPQKIGFSMDPQHRASSFAVSNPGELKVSLALRRQRTEAIGVERLAHWHMRDARMRNEWFALSPEEAVEAVRAAALAYGHGERAPSSREPGVPTIQMVVPASWLERVEEWRRKQSRIPNRSEAIRLLVEKALAEEDDAWARS